MPDNPLTSELTLRTQTGEQAQLQNLPAPIMQALYHQLTGKTERLSKTYDDHYQIKVQDIKGLIEKFGQTLQQFNYKATSTKLTVFHHERDTLTFSSLDKFTQYDITKPDTTSAITIDIGLLISVPQVETHQNYKIVVELKSYAPPGGGRFPHSGIGGPHDDEHCVKFTIEYIDYVVARSFVATMDEWERSLDRTKLYSLPAWYTNNDWRVERGFIAVGTAAAMWGTLSIGNVIGGDAVVRIGAIAIVGVLANVAFETIYEIATYRMSVHRYFPFILLNKGDEQKYQTFLDKRRTASRVGFAILTSGVLVIIANVFARYISKKLGL